jgi:hypothetical protein
MVSTTYLYLFRHSQPVEVQHAQNVAGMRPYCTLYFCFIPSVLYTKTGFAVFVYLPTPLFTHIASCFYFLSPVAFTIIWGGRRDWNPSCLQNTIFEWWYLCLPDSQTPVNKVILHIHHHQGWLRPYNLQNKPNIANLFAKKYYVTGLYIPHQVGAVSL